MTGSAPTPPPTLSDDLVATLEECPPDRLRQVARYAESLADHRDRLADDDEGEAMERPDDLPDDVPAKATITVKEINDNRYYYWQWREGDDVKSKYKGPVDATD